MPIFFKMTDADGDPNNGPVVSIDEAKSELDAMVSQMDEGGCEDFPPSFTFTAIELTQEEYEELPEFMGF